MARRKNSNEAIESVEPTDIEMDVENEEYDSQENVNEEAEINTEIESTQSSESETEPVENSESENSQQIQLSRKISKMLTKQKMAIIPKKQMLKIIKPFQDENLLLKRIKMNKKEPKKMQFVKIES